MARTIQRKIVAQKSPIVRYAEAAAKAIVKKGPRPTVYRPSKRTELEIRKYQKSTELLLRKESFKRSFKATIDVLCEEEGFRISKIQPVAVESLPWPTKAFISHLFRDSVDEMVHAKRETLHLEGHS